MSAPATQFKIINTVLANSLNVVDVIKADSILVLKDSLAGN